MRYPLIALGAWSVFGLAGCSSEPIKTVEPLPHDLEHRGKLVVTQQNMASAASDFVGENQQNEFVVSKNSLKILSMEERVRWIAPPAEASERIQRQPERHAGGIQEASKKGSAEAQKFVDSAFFEVVGDDLGVSGLLELQKYKVTPGRYIVEFFHKGEIDPSVSISVTEAWNKLSVELKNKGLDPKSIVIAGSQYNKNKSGILLIKIKKDAP
jgi:hypothetical protein